MRWLHYAAFGLAFLGAQACSSSEPEPPPPFQSGAQASTDDGSEDGPPPEEPSPELTPSEGSPLEPTPCSVTFTKDVLPKIQDQWRCGASMCHGNPGAHAPVMDTKNAAATYTLLTTTTHTGKKLVDTTKTSPDASALHCLMKGTCGSRMPYQGVSELDVALVDAWLKCGAPR